LEAVEYATLDWVDWFNNRRLLEPIGHVPPAEAEAAYYASLEEPAARAATPRREPVHRPRFSPSTAQVPLDVLEGPRERGGWLARVASWFGHATSRRRPLRGT
ncbi:MAG TPA: hypothetical protein PKZ28_10115, partial [Piscinibacter sp.]|nr:hypothetical protein [Piscinibacter sp.]